MSELIVWQVERDLAGNTLIVGTLGVCVTEKISRFEEGVLTVDGKKLKLTHDMPGALRKLADDLEMWTE